MAAACSVIQSGTRTSPYNVLSGRKRDLMYHFKCQGSSLVRFLRIDPMVSGSNPPSASQLYSHLE